MKRLACIVALLALAAAAEAETPSAGRKTKLVVPPKPAHLALRGPQSMPPRIKLAAPPFGPVAGTSVTTSADPYACRTTCAHSYYFCLAGEDAPDCSQRWSRCQTACSDPSLVSR
ncbi:MAG TPA: hypothetical protein VJP88_04465 [Caulobacteraceae bacterium]|nr:hypothetical protein [Caulobacteraceae bacterium]